MDVRAGSAAGTDPVAPLPFNAYPVEFAAEVRPVLLADTAFRVLDANNVFLQELDRERDDLLGRSLTDLWTIDAEVLAARVEQEAVVFIDVVPATSSSTSTSTSAPAAPTGTLQVLAMSHQGRCVGYAVGLISDGTRQAKRDVTLAAEGFALSFDQLAVGMIMTGLDGFAIRCNAAAARLLGRTAEEIAESDMFGLIHPDHRASVLDAGMRLLAGETDSFSHETRMVDRDGGEVWIHETTTCVRDSDANPLHFVSQWVDIRDRKQAESELRRAMDSLLARDQTIRFLFDGTPVPLMQLDPDLNVAAANVALRDLIGWDPIGQPITEIVHPDDYGPLAEAGAAVVADTDWVVELRIVRHDGSERLVRSHGRINLDEHGGLRSATAAWHDITDAKLEEEALRIRATTDSLTGLANRSSFLDRLREVVDGPGGPACVAVLFVDLDRFKSINDRHGHAAGDEVLRQVAQRLRGCVRPGDTVARLGGDEFVVIVDGVGAALDAEAIGQRVVDELGRRYATRFGELTISASVGLAVGASGVDPRDIVHRADLAAYRVKALGGSRLSIDAGLTGPPPN